VRPWPVRSRGVSHAVTVATRRASVLSRGKQVIAHELRRQVHSLGIDGAPVQLERTQRTVHQQAGLADGEPVGSLEPVPLRLLCTSRVLGLLVSGASPLVCRNELAAVGTAYQASADSQNHSGLTSSWASAPGHTLIGELDGLEGEPPGPLGKVFPPLGSGGLKSGRKAETARSPAVQRPMAIPPRGHTIRPRSTPGTPR
jgi:hypothetical protein